MESLWLLIKIAVCINIAFVAYCIILGITDNQRRKKSGYADCFECGNQYPKPLMIEISKNFYICISCFIKGERNQSGRNLLEYLLKEIVDNKGRPHFGFK
jgi:hypothetical protein